jgi:chloramphenicol-sensitive protein RarD
VTRATRGLMYGVLAYVSWGLLPLYWPLLEPAGPLEILACRIVFSLVAVTAVMAVRHELSLVRRLDRTTRLRLGVAGLVIAVNWGAYIWGVNNGHVLDSSLGYFICPLLVTALGVLFLHERLRPVQWIAVGLGVVAVAILTVDYARPPWLALFLAVSFAGYALIKKSIRSGAPEGVVVETAATVVPALAFLAVLAAAGGATWIGHGATPGHLLLLAGSGPLTAIPLLLFAGAAKRLPLSSVGLLQYIAPALQFVIGGAIRGEPLPPARLGGFAVVWIALIILTADAVRQRRTPSVVAAAPAAGIADPAEVALGART